VRQAVRSPQSLTSHPACNHQLQHRSVLCYRTTYACGLHEHICREGMSSSSRTSSSRFCVPKRSREFRACIGEDATPNEEVEDLEECPRDHKDNLGDAADEVDEVGVCCDSAILRVSWSNRGGNIQVFNECSKRKWLCSGQANLVIVVAFASCPFDPRIAECDRSGRPSLREIVCSRSEDKWREGGVRWLGRMVPKPGLWVVVLEVATLSWSRLEEERRCTFWPRHVLRFDITDRVLGKWGRKWSITYNQRVATMSSCDFE